MRWVYSQLMLRILAEMTIRAGHIVFDLNARAEVPWHEGNLKYATR